ncbi:hypothetical protein GOBAR_AA31489 [Gossypium barbadense]|uniref:CASP-like protein n=1 Tax=Gossypium barbadense TaxID=3634 RepID=A0A2P5WDL2_GOSBA|nr:hypothetical protein GOBAR_AA31489 [Gossypium barbadense]
MELSIQKIEALIRLSTIVMLVLTACLIGLDSQTKVIFYVQKKASFKDLRALVGLLYITSLAAAYNLLQLCCSSFSASYKGSSLQSYAYLAWLRYILDQVQGYNLQWVPS